MFNGARQLPRIMEEIDAKTLSTNIIFLAFLW
jgi:hypothetical protein